MKEKIIFFVEDDFDDRVLIERAFEKCHAKAKIVFVKDGVEALDYLFRKGEYKNFKGVNYPDVIILDMKLPRIDGIEVLKSIRENQNTKYIPVVIFTSSSERKDILEAMYFGANSYLIKPVEFEKFTEIIANIHNYWINMNTFIY